MLYVAGGGAPRVLDIAVSVCVREKKLEKSKELEIPHGGIVELIQLPSIRDSGAAGTGGRSSRRRKRDSVHLRLCEETKRENRSVSALWGTGVSGGLVGKMRKGFSDDTTKL